MFAQPEALLSQYDSVYGESFAHRFVPEVAVPPSQRVRFSDVAEQRRPALQWRVENADCNQGADGVCAANAQRRAAVGVEAQHCSKPYVTERESTVDDLRRHVRLRWLPVLGSYIRGIEAVAIAYEQPEGADAYQHRQSSQQKISSRGIWRISSIRLGSHSRREQRVDAPV